LAFFSTPIDGLCTIENLAWLVVALGVLLRVHEYTGYRALYMDEESLLHNLTGLAVFDFHTRLSEEQLAPPGFLVVERLMVRLRLDLVWSARFLPLVCGIGSVFLMRLAARRFISRPAVPIAVGLFALSDWLLYYSAEIKQYSTDVALTLVALLLAARLKMGFRDPGRARLRPSRLKDWLAGRLALPESYKAIKTAPRSEQKPPPDYTPPSDRNATADPADSKAARGGLLALAFFGAAGVWFSYPLAFVLAGVGTWLMASAAIRRDWKGAQQALLVSMVWAVSFAGCFAISQAILPPGQFIWLWWDFAFLPLPPRSAADLERVFWQIVNVFNSPADVLTPLGVLPSAFLALGLFLAGGWTLGRRWPGGLYLLASPILFALVASALRKYPFHGRLLLFLVPTVHLLVAEGATSLVRGGSLVLRGLAARLPEGASIKIVFACTYAILGVAPAFLLYQPAADGVWRYAIKARHRDFDSHGDLRADLLDYREDMERKARRR